MISKHEYSTFKCVLSVNEPMFAMSAMAMKMSNRRVARAILGSWHVVPANVMLVASPVSLFPDNDKHM